MLTPPQVNHDSDVELLPLESARVVYTPPTRPLWDLDRRDFIMIGIGSCIAVAAIAIGIFAAKFNSKKMRRGIDDDE